VASSLDQALDALEADHEFLTRGGVFSEDMLEGYIAVKRAEVQRYRMQVQPIEYEMYYAG
jgi:glutamine synthetase